MTVYIATAGNYDDYQILEVFLSQELADSYIDRMFQGYGRVEEWEVQTEQWWTELELRRR